MRTARRSATIITVALLASTLVAHGSGGRPAGHDRPRHLAGARHRADRRRRRHRGRTRRCRRVVRPRRRGHPDRTVGRRHRHTTRAEPSPVLVGRRHPRCTLARVAAVRAVRARRCERRRRPDRRDPDHLTGRRRAGRGRRPVHRRQRVVRGAPERRHRGRLPIGTGRGHRPRRQRRHRRPTGRAASTPTARSKRPPRSSPVSRALDSSATGRRSSARCACCRTAPSCPTETRTWRSGGWWARPPWATTSRVKPWSSPRQARRSWSAPTCGSSRWAMPCGCRPAVANSAG